MSSADDAYKAAQRLIAKARRDGAAVLDLNHGEIRALTTLPPEIASLTGLTWLDLNNTGVTDLTPLAELTGITELYLNNTGVTDLRPLAKLTGITWLYLNNTKVTDLRPLAKLTEITRLGLANTGVTSLTPLTKLASLTTLRLDNTGVTALTPLANLTGLKTLTLDKTGVFDLRPTLRHRKLAEDPLFSGLTFKNTAATRIDKGIAEIAEIVDNKTRAALLFDHLQDWEVPVEAGTDAPTHETSLAPPAVPGKSPAPLATEIRNGQLIRAKPQRETATGSAAEHRARQGWDALKDYRESFGSSFNVSNYAPLPAILKSFDRALEGSFDDMRQIAVGMHGQRIVLIAQDEMFLESLPSGGAAELKGFAAAVGTFVNRFPDWVAYQEDAETAPPTAHDVAQERQAFQDLEQVLAGTDGVAPDVAEEFADEVKAVSDDPDSEIEAKGLLATARDVTISLSEHALEQMRSGEAAKTFVQRAQETGDTELPKLWYWVGPGIAAHMLGKMNPGLRRLARRFPSRMGWVDAVLDYLGYPCDQP
jgi:Leucine Rich Repeat (LRR) protein